MELPLAQRSFERGNSTLCPEKKPIFTQEFLSDPRIFTRSKNFHPIQEFSSAYICVYTQYVCMHVLYKNREMAVHGRGAIPTKPPLFQTWTWARFSISSVRRWFIRLASVYWNGRSAASGTIWRRSWPLWTAWTTWCNISPDPRRRQSSYASPRRKRSSSISPQITPLSRIYWSEVWRVSRDSFTTTMPMYTFYPIPTTRSFLGKLFWQDSIFYRLSMSKVLLCEIFEK